MRKPYNCISLQISKKIIETFSCSLWFLLSIYNYFEKILLIVKTTSQTYAFQMLIYNLLTLWNSKKKKKHIFFKCIYMVDLGTALHCKSLEDLDFPYVDNLL